MPIELQCLHSQVKVKCLRISLLHCEVFIIFPLYKYTQLLKRYPPPGNRVIRQVLLVGCYSLSALTFGSTMLGLPNWWLSRSIGVEHVRVRCGVWPVVYTCLWCVDRRAWYGWARIRATGFVCACNTTTRMLWYGGVTTSHDACVA